MNTAILDALPLICFTRHIETGQTICIMRGYPGYRLSESRLPPEILNAVLYPVPTPAQISAMEIGSMFGWDVPGIDPTHPINADAALSE